MRLEEWIIGATYSVKEQGGTVTLLGKLIDKYLLDGIVMLDFRKEDGEEHLYFVEEGVEYIASNLLAPGNMPPPSVEAGFVHPIRSKPQEAEATQNTAAPLTLADPV